MTTDVTVITQEQIDNLSKRAGAEAVIGDFIPQLKINYDDEDKEGNELTKGVFLITNQPQIVYSKTVKFRPLTHHFQWIKYDDVAKKVTNRTRFIPNFLEEPRDEQGTLRCGKPPSKELKANPALAKKYEDITCYRTVQGVASYEGKTATGEVVSVDGVECALRLKGANFSPFEEEYFGKLGGGKIWDHELTLSATKEKNGASTYYVIHFDTDFTTRIPLTANLFTSATKLMDKVDLANKSIDAKFYDAIHKQADTDKAVEALKVVGGSSTLDGDFDDTSFEDNEIPF